MPALGLSQAAQVLPKDSGAGKSFSGAGVCLSEGSSHSESAVSESCAGQGSHRVNPSSNARTPLGSRHARNMRAFGMLRSSQQIKVTLVPQETSG